MELDMLERTVEQGGHVSVAAWVCHILPSSIWLSRPSGRSTKGSKLLGLHCVQPLHFMGKLRPGEACSKRSKRSWVAGYSGTCL